MTTLSYRIQLTVDALSTLCLESFTKYMDMPYSALRQRVRGAVVCKRRGKQGKGKG